MKLLSSYNDTIRFGRSWHQHHCAAFYCIVSIFVNLWPAIVAVVAALSGGIVCARDPIGWRVLGTHGKHNIWIDFVTHGKPRAVTAPLKKIPDVQANYNV
jgi:hypothetical protein